jgi:1A family penicillin-binding protein
VLSRFVSLMPRTRFVPQWLWALGTFFVGFLIFTTGIFAAWASVVSIPSIDNFENRKIAQSTKIYDRTGNIVLYDVHGSVRRTAVPLSSISPFIQKASVAIEDAQFYQHNGFRLESFVRAALANLSAGSYAQGGSTITQQVVKNTLLTTHKTVWRKVEEIILALRLERVYSKDQILETYLNEIGYGGTVYGVEEASQYFFGVSAKDVDLAQAAYLAALPQAPTRLSPFGNHRDELDARQKLVLSKMQENGFINADEYKKAVAEKVEFKSSREAGIKAPHFVFFIREYLEQKYGPDVVENGGLRVITTLDYDLQQKAEEIVHTYALKNEKNFNASNAGLVAIDPKTGQILAMVGSRDYFDPDIDGKVNVTLSLRQPGSSFKPFVYATALQKGYTPETVVFDLKTQFSSVCDPNDVMNDTPPCYSPDNYDGNFKGPMTLRNALAQSQNIPAIKVLYLSGIKDSIKTAQALGITTLVDADHYGLTLVLGGGEVKLLEETSAYGVFANDGVRSPPTGILRVEDKGGDILESFQDQSAQVIDSQVARQINDMLSDNVARTPEFGSDSPLYFPGYDVADKTGTTNDFRDTWIIGYTPGIVVGTWAGNNDNSPMVKKIAAFIVAPMWHSFMEYALEKYPSDEFVPPSPDTENLPPVLMGNWNSNPSLGIHDILYWVDKSNPRGGPPANPFADIQTSHWEYPVQLWLSQGGLSSIPLPPGTSLPGVIPTVEAPVAPGISFQTPTQGQYVPWGFPVTATISYPPTLEVSSVSYYVDGGLVGTATQPPFTVKFNPGRHGPTIIRASAQTNEGTKEATVTFSAQ